ncbi:MAG TPA: ribosome maturation factor RimP [Deltaproteobacteria bacterium]|nr:ribosome maturation factor RimP [Deltaproteobacteria bacterium]
MCPGVSMDRIPATQIADRAEQLLGDVVREAGFHLLLCELVGGGRGPVLRLYIERVDGESVGIEDCVLVNNIVTDLLDTEDFIPGSYSLEVSSPGLERPLKRAEHYEAQLGERIKVKTWEPIQNRRNWTGTLTQLDGDIVTIRLDEGQDHRIPIPAVERAHLVYVAKPKGQKKGGSTRKKRGRANR